MLESIKRHKGLIILAALLVSIMIYGLWPKAMQVDIVKVWRGPMTISINEEGKTRVIDRFIISAPVAGYKRRIQFEIGDKVSKNDVIVTLEPLRSTVLDPRSHAAAKAKVAAAKAALQTAEENLKAAIADATLAQQEFIRQQKLIKQKLVARSAYDLAKAANRRQQANKRSAEFAVQVARFELEAAQTTLKYSADSKAEEDNKVYIKAPVSGQILKIHHKSEGVVNSGQALVEIGDPLALEVVIDVLSADAIRLSPGTAIEFKHWGGNEDLEGVVRRVEPVAFTKVSALGVEEQRVLIIADFTSAKELWRKLGDGYSVDANFIVWRGDKVLQVPSSAVFRYHNQWAVYTVNNKRAKLVPVILGKRGGLSVEILNDLKEGTAIIKHPDDNISDGAAVIPR